MAFIRPAETQDRRPTRTRKPSARAASRDLPQLSQNPLPTPVTTAKPRGVRYRIVAGSIQLDTRNLPSEETQEPEPEELFQSGEAPVEDEDEVDKDDKDDNSLLLETPMPETQPPRPREPSLALSGSSSEEDFYYSS